MQNDNEFVYKFIGKLKVSRKIVSLNDEDQLEKLELHGFSDASLQNYGACIYLRSIFKSDTISVSLVTSKSRLAPIKGSTVPRLEFLENMSLSRLMVRLKSHSLRFYCKHVFDELAGASIENVIDTKKYSSTRKLYRITSWVNRFANNLKEKLLNNAILLKRFVTVQELKRAQFQWIKRDKKLLTVSN